MPEGPELYLASQYINKVCYGRVFGRIKKSDVSKNPVVEPPSERFTIAATSRGKEIKLTLIDATGAADSKKKDCKTDLLQTLSIVFTFGLAGKFEFCQPEDLHKHAHLQFYTDDNKQDMVLSFVDYMRFGKWTPSADFAYKERGPCVLTDYDNFRNHVLQNMKAVAFDKPVCEVLLNQRYFNGIGNYLRAEILHRLKIPPFVSARSVLQPLADDTYIKTESPDLLQLCCLLPKEVVTLESSWYDGQDRSDDTNAFNNWLQCYYQDGMKNMVDHNKRTVWFSGPAGPLAPKDGQTRGKKRSKSKKKQSNTESDDKTESGTKKSKRKADDDTESKSGDSKPKRARNKTSQKEINIVKEGLKGGRLTRGKIKDIVDAIEGFHDQEPVSIKIQPKDKKVKSAKRKPNKAKDIKNEENDVEVDESATIVNQKQSKRKRVKSLQNGAEYLNSSGRKNGSLKTPKKSLKKL